MGPVRIESTEMVAGDVLVARLSGAEKATVAAVRRGNKNYFVAPAGLGGTRKIESCSLTDCLHGGVEEIMEAKSKKRRK